MSQNAPGGAPPNRISSEEVFVGCAGHPSRVETGEVRGEEEQGKGKGKGKGKGLHLRLVSYRKSARNYANGGLSINTPMLRLGHFIFFRQWQYCQLTPHIS